MESRTLEKNMNQAPAPCPSGSWAPTVLEQGLQDAKHHQHVSRHARSSNRGALPDASRQRQCNLQTAHVPARLALRGDWSPTGARRRGAEPGVGEKEGRAGSARARG